MFHSFASTSVTSDTDAHLMKYFKPREGHSEARTSIAVYITAVTAMLDIHIHIEHKTLKYYSIHIRYMYLHAFYSVY